MPSAGNEWIQLKNSLFNCNASNALPSFLMGFTSASKSASADRPHCYGSSGKRPRETTTREFSLSPKTGLPNANP
jgi:hypothetical protein